MRDTTKLMPKLQKILIVFLDTCTKAGYKVRITECLRTAAEQDALYAQGRTKPGNIVTSCTGATYSSMHQWGVAFDICRNDGKGAYNNEDGWFNKVGKIGQSCGLLWGGSWTSFVDLPHYQLPDWGDGAAKLKSIYGTPDRFKATWDKAVYPDYADKTSSQLDNMLAFRTAVKSLQVAINQEHNPVTKLAKTGCPSKDLLALCPKIGQDTKDRLPKTVKAIQQLLKWHGYDVVVNGNYGRRTKEAVIKFKLQHDIDADSTGLKKAGKAYKVLMQMT